MRLKLSLSNSRNKTEFGSRRATRLFTISIALCVMLLAVVPLVSAQDSYQPPTIADLVQFRLDLIQVSHQLQQNSETFKQNKFMRGELRTNPRFNAAPSLAQAQ